MVPKGGGGERRWGCTSCAGHMTGLPGDRAWPRFKMLETDVGEEGTGGGEFSLDLGSPFCRLVSALPLVGDMRDKQASVLVFGVSTRSAGLSITTDGWRGPPP